MNKIDNYLIILLLCASSFIINSCVEGKIYEGPEINIKQGTTAITSGSGVFDFGNILPDGDGNTTSGYVLFDIENSGDEDLVLSSVTCNAGDTDAFDLVDSTIQTLPPSGTTQFSIRFDPLEAREYSATVTIANNYENEGTYTFTIIGTGSFPFVNTIQKIVAADAQANNQFGNSVSISSDYAIVGAPNAGAAYIFHKTAPNTWDSGVKIVASDAQTDDNFGWSVSISGDYAIVGALHKDFGTGVPLSSAGAAYIFHRTGPNIWDSGVKIVATDPQEDNFFGGSVSISGDYAIIGAYGEAGGVGSAYIFHRTETNIWDSDVKIAATSGEINDWFGWSVSISGDYVIVGAKNISGGAGYADIFHRTETNTWDSGVAIHATDPQPGDRFGVSVAISEDFVIVGANNEDGGSGDLLSNAGAAYIFHKMTTNTWDSGVKIVATDPRAWDCFGSSVGISGDYAIVGATYENAGAAYIFQRTAINTWNSGIKIIATDPQEDDYFGASVGISGDYAIVGAYGEDGPGDSLSNAGAVYIFE